jgi:hypothetical protein
MTQKLTKQGVRDLSTSRTVHVHRHVPHTYITRSGAFDTQMRCYCGDVFIEPEEVPINDQR